MKPNIHPHEYKRQRPGKPPVMPKTRTGLRIRIFHVPSAAANGNGSNGVDDYSAVIPPPLSHTPGPSPLMKPLSQSLPVSPMGSFSLGPPSRQPSTTSASPITVTDATLEDLLSGAYLRSSFTQKNFFEPINVETTPLSRPTTPSASAQPGASAQRIWIQISNFGSSASNSALLHKIGAHFRLHPLTIADLESEDTREKLEVFPEYMLLCIHAIQQPTPTIFDIVTKERVEKARSEEEKKVEQERQFRASRFFGGILYRRQPPLRSQSHPALPLSAPSPKLPPIQYDDDVNPFDDISTTSIDASYVDEEEHLLAPKKRPGRNGIFQSAGLTTSAIKLIVFPHVVISFHHGLQQSEINAVCRRLNQFSESRMDTGAWIMHAMLDTITSSMQPIVDEAVDEIDRLEELIYALDGQQFQDLLKRMGLTRRRLVALTQQVKSKSSIINSMLEADRKQQSLQSAIQSPLTPSTSVQSPYLRDVYDHLDQQNVKIDCAAQVLHALQDSYLATVQLHAESMSQDINRVMKTFSAFATIMLPLSLIAGILGMNVEVPNQVWERGDGPSLDSLTPFWTVVGIMFGIGTLMYVYFRRRGYM